MTKVRYKLVLFIITLAIFLNDWQYSVGSISFSFSDILIIVGLFVTIDQINSVSKGQLLFFLSIMITLLLNILLNSLFNIDYIFSNSYIYLLKIPIYLIFIINSFNYIKKNKLEVELLRTVYLMMIFVAIIGLYIWIVQYFKLPLPYEFFWSFTRDDALSYTYRRSDIIRLRSIASEPQYFGLLTTFVLGLAYFNNKKYRLGKYGEAILIFTGFLTFSFSTIPAIIAVKMMDLIKTHGGKLFFSRKFWISLVSVAVLFFLLYDFLNVVIFDRFLQVVNKEDTSAVARIVGSWSYVDHLWIGNGVGNTPSIWNNFAYVLSDFGSIPFLLFIIFTCYLVYSNFYFGALFILFSFQKGGYLSASYWIVILLIVLYGFKSKKIFSSELDIKESVTKLGRELR